MPECPHCRTENKPHAMFCRGCGASLAKTSESSATQSGPSRNKLCVTCGGPVSPGETVCASCQTAEAISTTKSVNALSPTEETPPPREEDGSDEHAPLQYETFPIINGPGDPEEAQQATGSAFKAEVEKSSNAASKPITITAAVLGVVLVLGVLGYVVLRSPRNVPSPPVVPSSPGVPSPPVKIAEPTQPSSTGEETKADVKVNLPASPGEDTTTKHDVTNEPITTSAQTPLIESFRADPGSVEQGGTVFLRWSVSGTATNVTIEPGSEALPLHGEKEIHPERTTQYILKVEGPGGSVSNQFTVNVIPMPPPSIMTFQGDPGAITAGSGSFLRWAVSGRTTSLRIEPGIGPVPAQGEREVRPEKTTQYTLTAEGPGGMVLNQFTVRVAAPPADPPKPPAPTPTPTHYVGPSSGVITWEGNIRGTELITIENGQASSGTVTGSLPGVPVLIQPSDPKKVGVASAPGPLNQYGRLVLRISGNGPTRVTVRWSLP